MIEITLSANQSNQRLDKVLKKLLKEAPDSFIYKMLRKKNITLNGVKAIGSEKTVAGDRLQFFLSDETFQKMRGSRETVISEAPSFPEIPIIYEDSDVCLFVKPVGILSQKALPTDYSVNEWVIYHAKEQGLISDSGFETFRPSVCNRLDRNTGGIMAAGLSEKGLQVLSGIFRDRSIHKFYYALVKGQITEEALIDGYLVKDEKTNRVRIYKKAVFDSKPIRTRYTPVKVMKDRTLLKVELLTGRSHQIRAHLSSCGHPILGDPKYGDIQWNMQNKRMSQCLFAFKVVFPECELPGISCRTFEEPVPSDWPLS